jgi:hypothetical protein
VVLTSAGLDIRRREGSIGHTRQHNYYLTAAGRSVACGIVTDVPELAYDVDRVRLLVRLTAGTSPLVSRQIDAYPSTQRG